MQMISPVHIIRTLLSGIALMTALSVPAIAADIPTEVTLLKNVNVFDGKCEQLLKGYRTDASLRIYVPDVEKFKTWTPPKAERIESR